MEKLVAKCSFTGCNNPAEWVIGTWQCCDECAKTWVKGIKDDWGYSVYGTSRRIGQENIMKHNLMFEQKHNLITVEV